VKAGYKQTEVGVIPEDWIVKSVDEIADVKGGRRLPLGKSLSDTVTAHPYIRLIDMRFGKVKVEDIKYVPDDVFPLIKNYCISSRDIFISVVGATLGTIGKIPPELDGANLTENADRITKICCDQDFLLFNLLAERIQNRIESEKTVGAQPKLALTRIEKFRIALPPNPGEQRAIAIALSDADAHISSLEQVIAKKRDLKQAAMQELLIGKRRLPEYTEKWEVYTFGEIFTFLNTANYPWSDLSETGDVKYIHYGDVHKNPPPTFDSKKNELPFIKKEKVKDIPRVLDGDLVMVDAAEDYVGTGKSFEVINVSGQEIVAGLHTLLMRGDNNLIADGFKGYLQCIPEVKSALIKIATGISVYGISQNNVKKIEVTLPKVKEQTAIATVLSNMDAELTALEQQRDKTKAIKQGMMQELLTGRIRLMS